MPSEPAREPGARVPCARPPDALTLTGERTLPGIADERYWFERHVVAYRLAAARIGELTAPTVLDAGCGEGYGCRHLAAAGAGRVLGVDLDPRVVEHVHATYAAEDPRIEVARAELSTLPFADDQVDLTVSFQVIEHLWDVPAYLASLRRVTRPGREIWMATPNRLTFTPGSDIPVNPFHVREFTAAELHEELSGADLAVDRILGIHHGVRLRHEEARLGRAFLEVITEAAPEDWDEDLRAVVHATRAEDFEVTDQDLDASLDLLAICRVPDRPPRTRVASRSAGC